MNTTSAFVAAQQAVLAFAQLPESASRTFIFTGNCTNVAPIVALMGSGAGKSATAHIIQCAAEAYKEKGYKYVQQSRSSIYFINHLAGSTTPMRERSMARPYTVPSMDRPMPSSTLSLLREPHRDRGTRPLSKGLDTRSFRP